MGNTKGSQRPARTGRHRIKITTQGPYIVSGGVPLSKQTIICDSEGNAIAWRLDETFPTREVYSLCRCGQSKNRPFCDGSHRDAGFDGTEMASREHYMERAGRTQGPCLDLMDAPPLCAEARFCQPDGTIWELVKRSNDPAAKTRAIREAADCPSGRLVICSKDGMEIEPEFEPSIVVVEDPQEGSSGPIWVRGGVPLESSDGSVYEVRNRVTLCRCGKSTNRPFCDGRHLK